MTGSKTDPVTGPTTGSKTSPVTGPVRVGVAQWTPGRDPAGNLRTAEAAVRALAGRGCGLAVLPELWLCGYQTATLGADARAAAEIGRAHV